MGMSATQARYLNLIAQQSDLEFQGQQINESRTTLSEQTNNLYTQLQNMDVPTPPMTGDYTNLVYSAADGPVNYTLGAVRPSAKKPGAYNMDLNFSNVGDNLVKSNNASVITYSEPTIRISPVDIETEEYETGKYTTTLAGKKADYYLGGTTISGAELKGLVSNESDAAKYVVVESDGTYSAASYPIDETKTYMRKYTEEEFNKQDPDFQSECIGITAEKATRNKVLELAAEEIENYYVQDQDGAYHHLSVGDPRVKAVTGKPGTYTIEPYDGETLLKKDEAGAAVSNPEPGQLLIGGRSALSWDEVMAKYGDMIPEHLEASYLDAVKHAFPDDKDIDLNDFYFVVSTKGNSIDLTFYDKNEVSSAGLSGATVSGYNYETSTYTETRNYDYIDIQFDSTGRISKFALPTAFDKETGEATAWKWLDVTAKTETDEKAYADAMAKYEHKKYLYDQDQLAINAQMSIIQAEDKKLELKLTRLDNERTQITTEIEALKKVIGGNIESSYKTFSG